MRLNTFVDFMKWIKANDNDSLDPKEKKPSKVENDFKEKIKKIVDEK